MITHVFFWDADSQSGGGAEIQICLERVLPWLPGGQRSHCLTVLVNLAGNLPSSVSEKSFHKEVSYWRHLATKLPKGGARASIWQWGADVNCTLQELSIGEAESNAGT